MVKQILLDTVECIFMSVVIVLLSSKKTVNCTDLPSCYPIMETSESWSHSGGAAGTCLLPFEYNGTTYSECTSVGWHVPWCPLVDFNASFVSLDRNGSTWGECNIPVEGGNAKSGSFCNRTRPFDCGKGWCYTNDSHWGFCKTLGHPDDCVETGKHVSNCHGLPNGTYQSYGSCHSFIICTNNNMRKENCTPGTVWNDIAKECLYNSITCGVDKSDQEGRVLCNTDDLQSLCPTPTDLRIIQIFELEIEKSEPLLNQCNEQVLLTNMLKYHHVFRFRKRDDIIYSTQFITEQLSHPGNKVESRLQWDQINDFMDSNDSFVDTLFHVQYVCSEHVISLHQHASMTANYIVLTNDLDIYKESFYRSSNASFNDFLRSFSHQHDSSSYNCDLIIPGNTTVIYGQPDTLFVGNGAFKISTDIPDSVYHSYNPPQGEVYNNEENEHEVLTIQFREAPSENALIVPFKVNGSGNITITCGLPMTPETSTVTYNTLASVETLCTTSTTSQPETTQGTFEPTSDTMSSFGTGVDVTTPGNTNTVSGTESSSNTLQDGKELENSQQKRNAIIIGATVGGVVFVAIIILAVCIKRRKKEHDSSKSVANPLYSSEAITRDTPVLSATAVSPDDTSPDAMLAKPNKTKEDNQDLESGNITKTTAEGVIYLKQEKASSDPTSVSNPLSPDEAIYAKPDKGGIYKTLPPSNVTLHDTRVNGDVLAENEVPNNIAGSGKDISDGLIENDVYEESSFSKPSDAVITQENDGMEEDNGHVVIGDRSKFASESQAHEEQTFAESEKDHHNRIDNGVNNPLTIARNSQFEMVENSVYNQ